MIQEHKSGIAIATPESNGLLTTLLSELQKAPWQQMDYILDLSSWTTVAEDTAAVLKAFSTEINAQKRTFVVVSTVTIGTADDPNLAVVPTLQEAEDYIDFEQIQRDLGF